MNHLRGWILFSWAAIAPAMLGGAVLLRLLNLGDRLTPFQTTWLRAGHAHGGVLLLMSLLYYLFLERTAISVRGKRAAATLFLFGVVALSGGFFLHAFLGAPGQRSLGTLVSISGGVSMAAAVLFLVYALSATRRTEARA